MAKNETVKITPEGLNLLMLLNFNSMIESDGFYNQEVFLTKGFEGNTQYLFQCFGNVGAHPRSQDFDKDVLLIVVSNQMIDSFGSGERIDFITDLENLLNQEDSPYLQIKFVSEKQIVGYFENRAKQTDDEILQDLIRKYRESKKEFVQQTLF